MKHRPRKRFGQNFLHDQRVIDRIIACIAPQPSDLLVEIGPGQAALTWPLLKTGAELHLIEIDRDLVAQLQQQFSGHDNITIHGCDALKADLQDITSGRPFRLIGNLPYNISTPLIFHVLQWHEQIIDMHFMLQKEVVDRMAAAPGGGDYGRLSVMIQYHCRVEPLFRVGPGAFKPAPRVDSALVRLTPWPQPPFPVKDTGLLTTLVRQAFSQRRKTLRNALKGLLSEQGIRATGTDPAARPETIGVEQYVALANQLATET